MDVFAHGFWATLYGMIVNRRLKKKLNLWHVAFWGVFPDILAFSPLFVDMIIRRFLGDGRTLHSYATTGSISMVTKAIYSLDHSLIIFSLVAAIVWFIQGGTKKHIPWVLGGWLLHILFDIPTHTHQFYPTPFLWPLSHFTFNGIFWGTPWFMVVNYSVIISSYLLIRYWPVQKHRF